MKRLALLVSLALLTVVGTAATTQAYYLDTPHNESNGIYCWTCHSMSAWTNFTSTGPDDTLKNRICLSCHTEGGGAQIQGPSKKVHSETNTSGEYTGWTTECTQCHDAHAQGQMDWAPTDSADLYLAQGTIASGGTFNANPVDAGLPASASVSGITTFTISGVTAQTGYTDTATWASKGGNIDPARAVIDGTRGLIFVPDITRPSETYEIVSASPTLIKVKGRVPLKFKINRWQLVTRVGNTFGVIYGQAIKSYVMPNGGTTAADLRDVKFYQPAFGGATTGGFVDTAAATPEDAKGICQVCHTNIRHYTSNGTDTLQEAHYVGEDCGECHNILNGTPEPPITAEHTVYIVDRDNCGSCHSGTVAAPDQGDHSSCNLCHTPTRPTLNDNAMAFDTGSILVNLHAAGYQGGTQDVRLTDSLDRLNTDVNFTDIDCGTCHLLKPQMVLDSLHGSHADTEFAWDGNCNHCHSGANIAEDVHNTTLNTCDICHTLATGGGGLVAGDGTNGVDGDATLSLGSRTSACSVCHPVDSTGSGTVHHVSLNNYATGSNCVICHKVSSTGGTVIGNHAGDHTNSVGTDVNCVPCHSINVGTTDGAPVDGSVIVNKKHDTCVSCHYNSTNGGTTTIGGLRSKANIGGFKVAAMAADMPAIGTCTTCHGSYFANHTHSHATSVTTTALCGTCHTTLVGNTVTDALTHNNVCADCHNMTTGARVNGDLAASYGGAGVIVGTALVNGGAGGNCVACHANYFNAHLHNHATDVTTTADCLFCHGQAIAGSNARDAVAGASPYLATTADVHYDATNSCAVCHSLTDGGLIGSATNWTTINTDCVACHTATWIAMHTVPAVVHTGTRVGTTVGACDTCHGAPTPGTSEARDAQTTPYIVSGEVHYNSGSGCALCHTGANDGLLRTTGLVKATANVPSTTCTGCHSTAWSSNHTAATLPVFTHNVTTSSLCSTTCHNDNPVSGVDTHNSNCADCHNLTTGARVNGAANIASFGTPTGTSQNVGDATINSGAGGTCLACHANYFNAHLHPHFFTTVNASCANCHGTTPVGSAYKTIASPYTAQSGEVHRTNQCAGCHDLGTNGALIGLAAGKTSSTTDCVGCHTGTWTALHPLAKVPHTSLVQNDANCSGCHGNPTPGTSTARDAKVTPYIVAGDVHEAGCAACHNADGSNRTGMASADRVGTGNCSYCHAFTTTWSAMHTTATTNGVTHVNRVDGLAGCTTVCHLGTAGGAAGLMPVSSGDSAVHDACTTCHNATTGTLGTNNTVYGGNALAAGDCGTCHDSTYFPLHIHTHVMNYNVTVDTSYPVVQGCTVTCHLGNTWADILTEHTDCAKCHSSARNTYTLTPYVSVSDAITSGGADVTCKTCHTDKTPNIEHGGHSGDFADTTECMTCHPGADVVVNIHGNTCGMCHTSSPNISNVGPVAAYTSFGIDGDADGATGAAANWAGFNCLSCHAAGVGTNNFTSIGGIHHVNESGNVTCATSNCHTASKLTHQFTVVNDTKCSSCHDNAAGGSARNAITSPYIATGSPDDVHYEIGTGGGCTLCHAIAAAPGSGGALRTTGLPADMVLSKGVSDAWLVGTDGGGNCTACHGPTVPYFDKHANAPHTDRVAAFATCTSSPTGPCHNTGVVGTATTVPVDGTPGTKVHDACTTCHLATTGLLGTAGSTTTTLNPGGSATNDGGGACNACHTAYTLDTHTHNHSGVTYDAGTDLSQPSSVGCGSSGSCHVPSGLLTTWSGILNEHGSCDRCHTYTVSDGTEPDAGTNSVVIANYATVKCLTCHVAKTATAQHGGHSGDFADTTECMTCHPGADVVSNIHGDTCGMCHDGAGPTLANVGPVAAYTSFGIDGDADGATGAAANWAGFNCLSCHAPGVGTNNFTSVGGIHHENKSSNVTCTTATCHTASKLTHQFTVVNDTKCSSCHDNVAGGSARNAITSPYIATGSPDDVHYEIGTGGGCTLCHAIAAGPGLGGALRTTGLPADMVLSKGVSDAWLVGTDGGGNCTACHGPTVPYFDKHANAPHTDRVAAFATCTSSPTGPCHNTGVVGTATTVPVDGTPGTKVHDACTTCHLATTGLLGTAGSTTTTLNPGGSATNDGGGACNACHTAYTLATHTHDHSGVTYDAGTDLSQNPGVGCGSSASCHQPSGLLTTWTGILNEHGSCDRCHTYTVSDGTEPDAGTNSVVIANYATVKCLTCHVAKTATAQHGGHNATDFAWTGTSGDDQTGTKFTCGGGTMANTCHNWTANSNVVTQVHNRRFAVSYGNNTCLNCHTNAAGGDGTVTTLGSNNKGDARLANLTSGPPHSENCIVCHTGSDKDRHHINNPNTTSGSCETCHVDPRPALGVNNPTQMACKKCHITVTGTTMQVTRMVVGQAGSTATGDRTGNPTMLVGSGTAFEHSFATNQTADTAITNFGACFFCHGSQGKAAGRAPVLVQPFHAMPFDGAGGRGLGGTVTTTPAYTLDNAMTGNSTHRVGMTIAPSALYGPGRGVYNLLWGSSGLADKSGDNVAGTTFKYQSGKGAWKNPGWGVTEGTATTLAVKIVEVVTPTTTAKVPVFDTSCSKYGGCSDYGGVAITSANYTQTTIAKETRVNGFTFVINATSTAGSSVTLNAFYGGQVFPMSWVSGNNFTVTITKSGSYYNWASRYGGTVYVQSSGGGNASLVSTDS